MKKVSYFLSTAAVALMGATMLFSCSPDDDETIERTYYYTYDGRISDNLLKYYDVTVTENLDGKVVKTTQLTSGESITVSDDNIVDASGFTTSEQSRVQVQPNLIIEVMATPKADAVEMLTTDFAAKGNLAYYYEQKYSSTHNGWTNSKTNVGAKWRVPMVVDPTQDTDSLTRLVNRYADSIKVILSADIK